MNMHIDNSAAFKFSILGKGAYGIGAMVKHDRGFKREKFTFISGPINIIGINGILGEIAYFLHTVSINRIVPAPIEPVPLSMK